MTRLHQWLFAGSFLTVIFCVSLSQAGLEIAHGRRPQFLDVFTSPPTASNLRAYERQLEDGSIWAQLARPRIQYVWFRLLGNGGEKAIVGRHGWLFYRPDLRYLVESRSDGDPVPAIIGFRDQLASRGIHLMVVPVPGKPAVYPDQLTTRASGVRSPTLDLIARLKRSGTEVVDLFNLFGRLRLEHRNDSEPWYLLRDTHWSGRAARAAAEMVAGRLRQLGWVQGGAVDYVNTPQRVERRSDIARMLRVPAIENAWPAESVLCERVSGAANGGPYCDDPNSPVLVLGDSFLRIYQTDEPRGAGFIAHLARELKQPLASIVNDGGASTLVRQELSRRAALLEGKKVVIWEFVERDLRFGTEGWKPVPLPPAMQALCRNP